MEAALMADRMDVTEELVPVSYTHLRAHETPEHLVCRLLLEKKKTVKAILSSSYSSEPDKIQAL